MKDQAVVAQVKTGAFNRTADGNTVAQVLPFFTSQTELRPHETFGPKSTRFSVASLTVSIRVWGSAALALALTALALLALRAFTIEFQAPTELSKNPWVYDIFSAVFFIYVTAVLFPFLLFVFWRGSSKSAASNFDVMSPPFVSIIIPAFDEETHVAHALKCALSQDYPSFEVIIVDDGSNDLTRYVADKFGARLIPLRKNGGKAAALNAGLQQAKGDVIVFSDADSFLDKNALRRLVRHFRDKKVGAVAGRVTLQRCSSMVQKLQELEYVFGQDIIKMAQIGSGSAVSVCPGPICAFRRTVIVELGGFTNRTLAEDFDLTLSAVQHGSRVVFEPCAVAYTDAPATWRLLLLQRIRWCRGALQVFKHHKSIFFNRRQGTLGLFWLPYFLVVGYGGAVFEALALVAIPTLIFLLGAPLAMIQSGLVFIGIIEAICVAQYMTGVFLSKSTPRRLVLWAVIIKPLNLFLTWVRLVAIWQELKGARRCW